MAVQYRKRSEVKRAAGGGFVLNKKSTPKTSIFTLLFAAFLLFFLVGLIITSAYYEGEADQGVGAYGTAALLASLASFTLSVASLSRRDITRAPAVASAVLNTVSLIAYIMLYSYGLLHWLVG